MQPRACQSRWTSWRRAILDPLWVPSKATKRRPRNLRVPSTQGVATSARTVVGGMTSRRGSYAQLKAIYVAGATKWTTLWPSVTAEASLWSALSPAWRAKKTQRRFSRHILPTLAWMTQSWWWWHCSKKLVFPFCETTIIMYNVPYLHDEKSLRSIKKLAAAQHWTDLCWCGSTTWRMATR